MAKCVTVGVDLYALARPEELINKFSAIIRDEWVYYCLNSEYFIYPSMETDPVMEMLAFQNEEWCHTLLTYMPKTLSSFQLLSL